MRRASLRAGRNSCKALNRGQLRAGPTSTSTKPVATARAASRCFSAGAASAGHVPMDAVGKSLRFHHVQFYLASRLQPLASYKKMEGELNQFGAELQSKASESFGAAPPRAR